MTPVASPRTGVDLTQGSTVAVIGAGCSIPLGYPSWRGFASDLVQHTLAAVPGSRGYLIDTRKRERLLRFRSRLVGTEPLNSQDLMLRDPLIFVIDDHSQATAKS